jgi:hypothetical protein
MYHSSVKTRCGIKKGWFGEIKVSSVGSVESDVPFDNECVSVEEPLFKTNLMLYEYYKRRDDK